MPLDTDLALKIAVPLATLALGKYLDRWFTRRPKLISYLYHTSAFSVRTEQPFTVHTHGIVVRNAGRTAANNVRIGHNVLPDNYHLFPAVPHTIERVQGGISEIVIPKLVPGEQVTISYLYQPPLLWNQINAYTKSDEGFAKILNVIPTPQLPKWALRSLQVLIFIGVATVLYLVIELIIKIAH